MSNIHFSNQFHHFLTRLHNYDICFPGMAYALLAAWYVFLFTLCLHNVCCKILFCSPPVTGLYTSVRMTAFEFSKNQQQGRK